MPHIFKVGDKDQWIAKIQRALNEIIYSNLVTDGQYGERTGFAITEWQKMFNLTPDGVYDGETARILDNYITERFLTEQDYKNAADKLKVEVPLVKAVTEVESSGNGFLKSGRVTILFERHVFYRELNKKINSDQLFVDNLYKQLKLTKPLVGKSATEFLIKYLTDNYGDIYNSKPGGYQGTVNGVENEYKRMDKAKTLDNHTALLSVSYGLFQIMGFNYKSAGFDTVETMYSECARSERSQLDGFCNFVLNDKRLIGALQKQDLTAFAIAYNGPAQNGYDKRLSEALIKWRTQT